MGVRWSRRAALAVFIAVSLATPVMPQTTPETIVPILTLDQRRLFSESLFGKSALQREQAETEALIAENKRIEAELEAEERQLTTLRPTLPVEEFDKLASDFDRRVEEIRATQDSKSRAITERRDDDVKRFSTAAVPILEELRAKKGAVAIVDKGAILVSSPSIDVTRDAILLVDSVLGDGSGPAKETSP
jgi:Skp family chaperone for outer membrane proteins